MGTSTCSYYQTVIAFTNTWGTRSACPYRIVSPARRGKADIPAVPVSCRTHPPRAPASHVGIIRSRSAVSHREDDANRGRRTRTSDGTVCRSSPVYHGICGRYVAQQHDGQRTQGYVRPYLPYIGLQKIHTFLQPRTNQKTKSRRRSRQTVASLDEVITIKLQLNVERKRMSPRDE